MKCPKCGCDDVKVIDSRNVREGNSVRRRRECPGCEHRFTTLESIVPAELYVVKRDLRRVEFDPQKIRDGIERACWKRPVRQEQLDAVMARILQQIENLGERELPSKTIGLLVMKELANLDQIAYVRFASVYRQFKDADQFIEEVQLMRGQAES
jgi:transcriptional repressor NrdR